VQAIELELPGAWLFVPVRHRDERGFFSEVYNRRTLAELGIHDDFVQDNHSLSVDVGVVRGLHFQIPPAATSKLVRVTAGAVFDVLVDLRRGSPTFGRHVAVELSAEAWNQVYVPVGFAHGFCTLQPNTEVLYKVTSHWSPDVDRGVAWDDPDLGIDWPVAPDEAIVSEKDRRQPRFADLPVYFTYDEETP